MRNYIIHHYLYDQPLEHYNELNSYVDTIPFIEHLTEKLKVLEKQENFILKKEVGRGWGEGDNFKFEYDHLITCLNNELFKLEKNFMQARELNPIPFLVKVSLENHTRNIITAMLDLTDKKSTNFYPDNSENPCHPQKNVVRKLNKNFEPDDVKCRIALENLSAWRRALSHHLDPSQASPYYNDMSLLEFVNNFIQLARKQYCEVLRTEIEKKMQARKGKGLASEEPSSIPFPIVHKTDLEAWDSMERAERKEKPQNTKISGYNLSATRVSNKQEAPKEEDLPKAQSPEKKKEKKSDDRRFSPRGGLK